jgi:hypothetical protein
MPILPPLIDRCEIFILPVYLSAPLEYFLLSQGGGVPAVVSKRGVDDGNQKGGGSPQPAQENQFHFNTNITIVK